MTTPVQRAASNSEARKRAVAAEAALEEELTAPPAPARCGVCGNTVTAEPVADDRFPRGNPYRTGDPQ